MLNLLVAKQYTLFVVHTIESTCFHTWSVTTTVTIMFGRFQPQSRSCLHAHIYFTDLLFHPWYMYILALQNVVFDVIKLTIVHFSLSVDGIRCACDKYKSHGIPCHDPKLITRHQVSLHYAVSIRLVGSHSTIRYQWPGLHSGRGVTHHSDTVMEAGCLVSWNQTLTVWLCNHV